MDRYDIYKMETLVTTVVHTGIVGYMGGKLEAMTTQNSIIHDE